MGFVRDGVKQTFERVDLDLKGGEGQVEEVEKRINVFTKKVSQILAYLGGCAFTDCCRPFHLFCARQCHDKTRSLSSRPTLILFVLPRICVNPK